MTLARSLAPTLAAAVAVLALAACQKGDPAAAGAKTAQAGAPPASAASVPTAALLVAPEDLRTVGMQTHASGPVITASVEPERRADLRAEVSAVVLQVYKENGEPVKKGDLLVRLDPTAIRDSLQSAEAASRAAHQAFDQAERTYERIKTLQAQGMSSMQALDDAEMRRNGAQSDLVGADARTVAARQQLERTEVRAPFDGVVSERKVSGGDTAAIGKELVKVIDPTSMRLEGLVSADRMGDVHPGDPVVFRVNGFERADFTGRIRHIDASADPTTRQVAVIVDFAPGTAPHIAGLYAEGRIVTGQGQAVLLPENTVAREGDKAYVWKVADRRLRKTAVTLGERDARRGEVVIAAGLAAGEQVLRNPGSELVDGQKVELTGAAAGLPTVASGR
jgi:RND family efflux transporter MFP subunit